MQRGTSEWIFFYRCWMSKTALQWTSLRSSIFIRLKPIHRRLNSFNKLCYIIGNDIPYCPDAERIHLKQVKIVSENDPVYSFDNSRQVYLEDVQFQEDSDKLIKLAGSETENIIIRGMDKSKLAGKIEMVGDIDDSVIQYK